MVMLAVKERVHTSEQESSRVESPSKSRDLELTCVCEKCKDMIDVLYHYVPTLNAIVIEARQDVTTILIHKPHEHSALPTCDGHMIVIGMIEHVASFGAPVEVSCAREETLSRDAEDDTLYEVQERIFSLYRDGHELVEITLLCDCDASDVSAAITSRAIKARRLYKRATQLQENDCRMKAIARTLGCTQSNIYATIKKYGENFSVARHQPSQDCQGVAPEKELD